MRILSARITRARRDRAFGEVEALVTLIVLPNETAGIDWLCPEWFRFGASSLLNDLLMQRQKLRTGHYSGADYVTID